MLRGTSKSFYFREGCFIIFVLARAPDPLRFDGGPESNAFMRLHQLDLIKRCLPLHIVVKVDNSINIVILMFAFT
jgi:hypothetical protein